MASSCLPFLQDMHYETKLSQVYFGYQTLTYDGMWTAQSTGTGAGSPASTEAEDGYWLFDSGTADNGESSIYSKKIFTLRDGVSFAVQAMVDFSQVDTDQAGIYLGFTDGPGAAFLTDTTLLPEASIIGASLYTTAGSIYWQVGAENGASRSEEATNVVAGGTRPNGTTRHIIGIDIKCIGTLATATYNVNELYLTGESSLRMLTIQKSFYYASNPDLAIQLGVKNGSANQQGLKCYNIAFAKTMRMP